MSDDAQAVPTIRLGEKDYPVKEFVWRDTARILPKMRKMSKIDWDQPTEEDMQLVGDVVHIAIGRNGSGITRDQVDEIPMSMRQIVVALNIISEQADLVETKSAGEPEAQPVSTGTS